MTDKYSDLKKAAEAARDENQHYISRAFSLNELAVKANPATVLALIAENERLRGVLPEIPPFPPQGVGLPRYGLRWNGPSNPLATPLDDGYWTPWHLADQLKAEAESLRAEVEKFKEANRSLSESNVQRRSELHELSVDNESLRKVLADCSDSLHGEMLQKFGGQLPDEMHPVTRRDYDRDMAEVAVYRAILSKEAGQ